MSETPKKLNLDAALREWPDVEKSPMELDESAQTVVARIQAGERGKTAATLSDENLFAAPLGQSPADGHNSAALAEERNEQREVPKMTMADRERDRRSLQDLAKLAQGPLSGLTPPPPSAHSSAPNATSGVQPSAGAAKGEDSGLIDLRAVNSEPAPSVAPAPTSSAKAHGLASQGLFDEEAPASMKQPAPSLPPMPASMPPASMPPQSMPQAYSHTPSAPPASMAPQAHAHASIAPAHASASQPALQANAKKGNGAVIALLFGGVVALGAAAAGTFFYLKSHKPAEAPVAAATQPAVDAKPAPTQAAAPADTTPAAEPTMDPNALPTATPDNKLAAAPKAGAAKPGARAAAPAAPAPEAPKAEAKLTQKDLPPAASGPAGDLGKALSAAVGDDGKPKDMKPAAADGPNVPAGSVPQKPSQGAVTGAIGAVLPSARVCLGPDDPVSHASIVFGSDGHVQSVTVTGAAQGKMAEGCIKDALMKAKVSPFAESSYSTRITVRHN